MLNASLSWERMASLSNHVFGNPDILRASKSWSQSHESNGSILICETHKND